MRELKTAEMTLVSGGHEDLQCPAPQPNNSFAGIEDTNGFGRDIINMYEGLVMATSHIIERVALSFGD